MDDARVADQNVQCRQRFKGGLDRPGICHIAADRRSAGLLCHSPGGLVIFLVQEVYPVAPAGKQANGRGADAPGSAGDQNS